MITIHYSTIWQEFQVRGSGKHPECTYYTSDKQDAIDTATAEGKLHSLEVDYKIRRLKT